MIAPLCNICTAPAAKTVMLAVSSFSCPVKLCDVIGVTSLYRYS